MIDQSKPWYADEWWLDETLLNQAKVNKGTAIKGFNNLKLLFNDNWFKEQYNRK